MNQFKGIVPAVVTPMNADGSVNDDALIQILKFNIAAGVHGFWVAGGTGESVLLDDEENRHIADISVDVCRGKAFTIHHVGAVTTNRAVALAEHAASVGADAICCVPTFFYPRSEEEIIEHYRVVANAANLPFFCYNLPTCTNIEITVDLMKKLQDNVPQLTGLKHSAPNFHNIRAFSSMGLATFTGSCHWMLPAMTTGAIGCVDGPPNIAPEHWVIIWKAFQDGKIDEARRAQESASTLSDALIKLFGGSRYVAICKHVLSRRLGIDCGDPRKPALPLSGDQRIEIDRILEQLELPAVPKPI